VPFFAYCYTLWSFLRHFIYSPVSSLRVLWQTRPRRSPNGNGVPKRSSLGRPTKPTPGHTFHDDHVSTNDKTIDDVCYGVEREWQGSREGRTMGNGGIVRLFDKTPSKHPSRRARVRSSTGCRWVYLGHGKFLVLADNSSGHSYICRLVKFRTASRIMERKLTSTTTNCSPSS